MAKKCSITCKRRWEQPKKHTFHCFLSIKFIFISMAWIRMVLFFFFHISCDACTFSACNNNNKSALDSFGNVHGVWARPHRSIQFGYCPPGINVEFQKSILWSSENVHEWFLLGNARDAHRLQLPQHNIGSFPLFSCVKTHIKTKISRWDLMVLLPFPLSHSFSFVSPFFAVDLLFDFIVDPL